MSDINRTFTIRLCISLFSHSWDFHSTGIWKSRRHRYPIFSNFFLFQWLWEKLESNKNDSCARALNEYSLFRDGIEKWHSWKLMKKVSECLFLVRNLHQFCIWRSQFIHLLRFWPKHHILLLQRFEKRLKQLNSNLRRTPQMYGVKNELFFVAIHTSYDLFHSSIVHMWWFRSSSNHRSNTGKWMDDKKTYQELLKTTR